MGIFVSAVQPGSSAADQGMDNYLDINYWNFQFHGKIYFSRSTTWRQDSQSQ